jgi:hypothetical protein
MILRNEEMSSRERIGLYIDYNLYSKLSNLRSIYLLSGKSLHDLPEMNDVIRAIVYLTSVEIQPNLDMELMKTDKSGKAKMNAVRDLMKLHINLNRARKSLQEKGRENELDEIDKLMLKFYENLSKELVTGTEESEYPDSAYVSYQNDGDVIENPIGTPQVKGKSVSTVAIMDDYDLEAIATIARTLNKISLSEHYKDKLIPEFDGEFNYTKSEIIRECLTTFFGKFNQAIEMRFIFPTYIGSLFNLSPILSLKLTFKNSTLNTMFTEEEKGQIKAVSKEIPTINNFISLTKWGKSNKTYLRELRKNIEPGSSKSHFIPINSENYGFSYHKAFLGNSYIDYMFGQGNFDLIDTFNSLIAEENRKTYFRVLEYSLGNFVSRLEAFKTTIESLAPL